MARRKPQHGRARAGERPHDADLHEERSERIRAEGPSHWFSVSARRVSNAVGTPFGFLGALSVILLWIASGPVFGFSDTWQLVINTGTTIVTFLMVFLIQNTQNRDATALHLKLDELLRAVPGARNEYMEAEEEDMEEILRGKGRGRQGGPRTAEEVADGPAGAAAGRMGSRAQVAKLADASA